MQRITYMTKLSTSFNKQLLDYRGLIKEMYYWRGSLWLFSSNGYREQRKFMRIQTEKTVLVLHQWADLYQFSKVSKRTNPEWRFKIFTFAGQRRLLELHSYGECNHLFISVTCFLKTTQLFVIVLSHSYFFLISKKNVHLHHFSEVEKYWLPQHRFKNTE